MRKLLPIVLVLLACNAFGESKEIAELRKKAEAGDKIAQVKLGLALRAELHKKAEAGDLDAQLKLGYVYLWGESPAPGMLGTVDPLEAVKWYRKAAEQGDAYAQYNLGIMHIDQFVLKEDYKEAVKWFRLAALQGDAGAIYELGGLYFQGNGVLKDYVSAYALLNLYGYYGHESTSSLLRLAKRFPPEQVDKLLTQGQREIALAINKAVEEERAAIAKLMTPEQIAKAQELSKELLKKIEANIEAKKK